MNLQQVFLEWRKWHPGTPKLVDSLGGLSNQSYLVHTDTEQFVVRLNLANENLGVSRDREHEILITIKDLPFAPNIAYWAPDYLITKFVSSKFVSSKSSVSPDLKTMAALFQQIHQVSYLNKVAMNPLEQLSTYYHQIDTPDQRLEKCYQALVSQGLNADQKDFCLCHHDLLPENIIQSNEGTTVIDWEYAQYGDPIFDLAIYAESINLSTKQMDLLIDAYGKEIDTSFLNRFRLIYGLINFLWWKIKKPRIDFTPRLLKLEQRIFL